MSQAAHTDHLRDAATAATYFRDNESDLLAANAVTTEYPLSLIGAAALWSGWVSDPDYLHETVVVLRPPSAFRGGIEQIGSASGDEPRP